MFANASQKIAARSIALRGSLEANVDRLIQGWLLLVGLASALRVATSPITAPVSSFEVFGPYLLLIVAPILSLLLAFHWFRSGENLAQPAVRLSRIGKWNQVSLSTAKEHPLYGADGIMVSLLIGLLLNVPVRAAEYFVAMPALAGDVPSWLSTLRFMMTLDVVLMCSLYTIAFVAAIKRVPLFPRLLVAIWIVDLTFQGLTAQMVAAEPGLPPAVAGSLHALLEGNVIKALISIGLWAPYLILSRRVNVTYRHRVPA